MELNLKKIHQLLGEGNLIEAQDVFRKMILRLPENELLSQVYILKAYELNVNKKNPFRGLKATQIEAHSILIRQLLIENQEEFDRRISRL